MQEIHQRARRHQFLHQLWIGRKKKIEWWKDSGSQKEWDRTPHGHIPYCQREFIKRFQLCEIEHRQKAEGKCGYIERVHQWTEDWQEGRYR
jgi:hypothetical protein